MANDAMDMRNLHFPSGGACVFAPKLVKYSMKTNGPPHVGALHSIASFCRYACIGFVMQFFRNHMENNIDESADRPGVLFDTFLTTAVQVAD